jgi:tetratricopeptide (TPR) repeat protein
MDVELYKTILENFSYNEIKDLIIRIHSKYKDVKLYKIEFEIFAEKNDVEGLKYLLEQIIRLENPSEDLVDFLANAYKNVKDARFLYAIGIYFIKYNNNTMADSILRKALEIVDNDEELRAQIMDRLNELNKESGIIEPEEPKIINFDDTSFKKTLNDNGMEESQFLPEIEITFDDKGFFEEGKKNIEDVDVKYNQALELIKNKSYIEAIDILKPLIDSSKKFDVLFNIGLCYDILKDLNNAIKYYQMAIEATDDVNYKCKLLMKIADIYFDLRDREETYKTLYEICRLDHNFIKNMLN